MALALPYHSDIQCASSTTTRDTGEVVEIIDRNSSFRNLSGETKSTWSTNFKCKLKLLAKEYTQNLYAMWVEMPYVNAIMRIIRMCKSFILICIQIIDSIAIKLINLRSKAFWHNQMKEDTHKPKIHPFVNNPTFIAPSRICFTVSEASSSV